MKYIKAFEFFDEKGDFYWSIPNEERRFKKSLEKIGCADSIIKELWNRAETYDEKILFITVRSGEFKEFWNLASQEKWIGDYKNKGSIELSKEDLEQIETEENTEKYNL